MAKGPFKMKGSPMARNFGIGTPLRQNNVQATHTKTKNKTVTEKIKTHIANSYAGSLYKGAKNVLEKRGETFRYSRDGDTYETGSGVIPTNRQQAKRIVKNFKEGYNRRTR